MIAAGNARIIFAGGGTGGHLYPALAIADRIRELLQGKHKVEIIFVGTKHGLEYRMRDSLGYPLHLINIRGLARSFSLRNLLLPFVVVGALIKAALLLRSFAPAIVIGTGGYVSWPVLKVAAWKNIPTVIQEQNSYPGITTRQTARKARKVYLGFEGARAYLRTNERIVVTGNPVRRSIVNGNRAEALAAFKLDPDRKTILVLGGSQGAHAVNTAILKSLESKSLPENYQLLWQTGKRDYKDVTAQVGDKARCCSLFPFVERMELVYAIADLAIARAGALTLAELAACGVPAILIPYPFAAGDHQRKNAQETVAREMAALIDENDLDQVDILSEAIAILESDRFTIMRRALTAVAEKGKPAVDVIAEDIINLIEDSRKGGV
ncbi:MAG: undecaprenyldiphospho-muramoylpentapeptide beta-N-acetylglucosaminyltransferase [candidate division Zixibacteria bacterium]|nr:undecaprenyldiphospho-muramoylpentapeptide beta-N-acetylglucosaminyltransferase [candidate division Zixibacteria bacterium]